MIDNLPKDAYEEQTYGVEEVPAIFFRQSSPETHRVLSCAASPILLCFARKPTLDGQTVKYALCLLPPLCPIRLDCACVYPDQVESSAELIPAAVYSSTATACNGRGAGYGISTRGAGKMVLKAALICMGTAFVCGVLVVVFVLVCLVCAAPPLTEPIY